MENTASFSDGESFESLGRALRSPTYSICYVKRRYTVRKDTALGVGGELTIDPPQFGIGQYPEKKERLRPLGDSALPRLPLPTPITAEKKREETNLRSAIFGVVYFVFAMWLLFSVITGIESSADIGVSDNVTAQMPVYMSENKVLAAYEGSTYVHLLCPALGIDTLISSPITTVDNFLSSQSYGFDSDDIVSCDRSTVITEGMEITVSVVDYKDTFEDAAVPYETENIYTTELRPGVSIVECEGENGTARQLVRSKYIDGEFSESNVLRYEIIQEPVKKVIRRGCRGFVSINGVDYPYSYSLDVEATAYGGSVFEGANTSTGKTVEEGMIAVDPTVIALGRQVYISGYNEYDKYDGFYSCEDTGGAIVGNTIDIYTGSEINDAIQFGRRQMKVWGLETPDDE